MTERRLSRRYDLSLPVAVRMPNAPEPRAGKTRDISTRGVYFTLDETLDAGMELDFTLTLPSEMTHDTDVLIRARGRVVRVEPGVANRHPEVGIAAVIERYDIVRQDSRTQAVH
jgi:PilZ domain